MGYLLDPTDIFLGFEDNLAKFTNPANNATGLYINHSQPVIAGYVSDGAKIGLYIQNTTFDKLAFPAIAGSTFIGPGSKKWPAVSAFWRKTRRSAE